MLSVSVMSCHVSCDCLCPQHHRFRVLIIVILHSLNFHRFFNLLKQIGKKEKKNEEKTKQSISLGIQYRDFVSEAMRLFLVVMQQI